MLVVGGISRRDQPHAEVRFFCFIDGRCVAFVKRLVPFVGKCAMEKRKVRGITLAFESLEIIALQETLGDISLIQRHLGPFIVGKQRHLVPRPEIGIDDAAGFMRGVSSVTQFFPEVAVAGLCWRIKYVAVHVVFPAVVDAAQAALFVAAVEKRGSAMRTTLAEQANASPLSRKATSSSPSIRTRTGGQSGWGISSDKSAGTQ